MSALAFAESVPATFAVVPAKSSEPAIALNVASAVEMIFNFFPLFATEMLPVNYPALWSLLAC
jgi:hypothetical protein